jgi:Protein of unknown function (DUF2505)
MPRPIRYQSRYPLPAAKLYAVLVDRDYLRAKLDEVGGENAELVELTADPDGARITLRQGVSRDVIPGPIKRVLRGDLVIERTETWRRVDPGHYDGSVSARVKDAPGSIGGALSLVDTDGGSSSEYRLDGSAKVDVPLLGGRIEALVANQVVTLIEREAQFTADWLAR